MTDEAAVLLEAYVARLRAKQPRHQLDADGFVDAAALIQSIRRAAFAPEADLVARVSCDATAVRICPTRSFLRRREAHWRRDPPHDAHVRAYIAETTPTGRTLWTCPRCRRELRFHDRPRGVGGKLKKHCGCGTGVKPTRVVDPVHRVLHDRISRELWCAMRGTKAGRKWQTLLGYTVVDLRRHLGLMLPRGYTLARCISERWHIDHIVPKSNFDCSTDDGVRAAWALPNLRLIPGRENVSKGSKRMFLL